MESCTKKTKNQRGMVCYRVSVCRCWPVGKVRKRRGRCFFLCFFFVQGERKGGMPLVTVNRATPCCVKNTEIRSAGGQKSSEERAMRQQKKVCKLTWLTDWLVCESKTRRKTCITVCWELISKKTKQNKKTIRVFTTGQQTDATYVHDGAKWEALVEAAWVGSKWSTLVITQSAPLEGWAGSDRGVYWCQTEMKEWICIFTQLLLVLQLTKKTGITLKKKRNNDS